MPTSPTTRVAIYARVSTTHHGQDVGLQLDAFREVASARGWVVAQELVDEGISGTKTTRPGLDAMMEVCSLGKVDVIAFWRLDRLGRSLSHVVQLLDELAALEVDTRRPDRWSALKAARGRGRLSGSELWNGLAEACAGPFRLGSRSRGPRSCHQAPTGRRWTLTPRVGADGARFSAGLCAGGATLTCG